MSATKFDPTDPFGSSSKPDQTRLTLPTSGIYVRKNGIEFLSTKSFPIWAEMTVDLQPPDSRVPIQCTGVVVACDGSHRMGYSVSMVFMNLSTQSQATLNALAVSQ